jgi:hypothetical protein
MTPFLITSGAHQPQPFQLGGIYQLVLYIPRLLLVRFAAMNEPVSVYKTQVPYILGAGE